jgi:hypothetical protein
MVVALHISSAVLSLAELDTEILGCAYVLYCTLYCAYVLYCTLYCAYILQAVPSLAEMGVESLTVFQRTPCWSPPRLDYAYPKWVKTMFALVPLTNTLHRELRLA